MPLVALSREALGRDAAALDPGRGLEELEQVEADGLLDRRVSLDLDVAPTPEIVERLPLFLEQPIEADIEAAARVAVFSQAPVFLSTCDTNASRTRV